ncbi:hypothetical protein GQ44DRAFT_712336 [Phaeosphaeriaceae sp. PMI808]|nr:hypothetical protein GQ44DRAFT_712336 [Phaeosphaeriaceae sp. PMI808]
MASHNIPGTHTSSTRRTRQKMPSKTTPAPGFNCTTCNRSFTSSTALQQHLSNSPVHGRSFERKDNNSQPLQQPPAPDLDRTFCHREFPSEIALQQHIKGEPSHNTSSNIEKALERKFRYLSLDTPSFHCKPCNRFFGNEDALKQHVRDSDAHHHQDDTETPLDVFFRSFPTFDYDPALPPATSYANLGRHKQWHRADPASADAWERYQAALQSELLMWYGEEDDLNAWHALCRAIGIQPLPQTCAECEKAVRRTHVNIVDLIEWGRQRSDSAERVRNFPDLDALRVYTKETRKIFHNTLDEENGNVVLRHLLRKIFDVSAKPM